MGRSLIHPHLGLLAERVRAEVSKGYTSASYRRPNQGATERIADVSKRASRRILRVRRVLRVGDEEIIGFCRSLF